MVQYHGMNGPRKLRATAGETATIIRLVAVVVLLMAVASSLLHAIVNLAALG